MAAPAFLRSRQSKQATWKFIAAAMGVAIAAQCRARIIHGNGARAGGTVSGYGCTSRPRFARHAPRLARQSAIQTRLGRDRHSHAPSHTQTRGLPTRIQLLYPQPVPGDSLPVELRLVARQIRPKSKRAKGCPTCPRHTSRRFHFPNTKLPI